jgi:hypothetical protein
MLLGARLTKSEMVYLLLLVEAERLRESPGADWAGAYARELARRYP